MCSWLSITHITYASREPLIKRLSREVISYRASYSSRKDSIDSYVELYRTHHTILHTYYRLVIAIVIAFWTHRKHASLAGRHKLKIFYNSHYTML